MKQLKESEAKLRIEIERLKKQSMENSKLIDPLALIKAIDVRIRITSNQYRALRREMSR